MKKIIHLYQKYLQPVHFHQCAALAYYSILALIPGLSLLFHVIGWFHISSTQLYLFIKQIIPLKNAEQLIDFVYQQQHHSMLLSSVIFITSLLIISSGILNLIHYINQTFKLKEHKTLLLRLRSIIVALFLILTLAFLLILFMFILPVITKKLPIFLYYCALYLCYVLIHFIIIFIIYKLCLYKDIAFKYIYKGIIFFSVIASLLYLLFSPLIKIFANNYASLGPLSGFASLLIFFYIYFVILFISLNISLIEYKKMLE